MDITPASANLSQNEAHPHAHTDKLLKHFQFPRFHHEAHPVIRNVNEIVDEKLTVGQKVADAVAANMGSWRFIIIQSIFLAAWIVLNTIGWIKHWDSYPFILLNLMLSFQAAYAAPFIMISQNRQAEKDRLTAQNDYVTDMKGEEEIRHIMEHLDHQDALILQIVQHLESQNERMKAQHEEMLGHLSRLDPDLAARLTTESQQNTGEIVADQKNGGNT
jgi:uncharacterized membrane protein